jgi:hypothetical protein
MRAVIRLPRLTGTARPSTVTDTLRIVMPRGRAILIVILRRLTHPGAGAGADDGSTSGPGVPEPADDPTFRVMAQPLRDAGLAVLHDTLIPFPLGNKREQFATGTNWRNPRYSFSNRSADIRGIFCDACARLGLRWTTCPHTVYVSRKSDVARLDEFIGPKT